MRQLLALYLILTSNITLAGELPNQTKVTPLNSQELGFEIIEVDSGDSETRVFKFKFPATIKMIANCIINYAILIVIHYCFNLNFK